MRPRHARVQVVAAVQPHEGHLHLLHLELAQHVRHRSLQLRRQRLQRVARRRAAVLAALIALHALRQLGRHPARLPGPLLLVGHAPAAHAVLEALGTVQLADLLVAVRAEARHQLAALVARPQLVDQALVLRGQLVRHLRRGVVGRSGAQWAVLVAARLVLFVLLLLLLLLVEVVVARAEDVHRLVDLVVRRSVALAGTPLLRGVRNALLELQAAALVAQPLVAAAVNVLVAVVQVVVHDEVLHLALVALLGREERAPLGRLAGRLVAADQLGRDLLLLALTALRPLRCVHLALLHQTLLDQQLVLFVQLNLISALLELLQLVPGGVEGQLVLVVAFLFLGIHHQKIIQDVVGLVLLFLGITSIAFFATLRSFIVKERFASHFSLAAASRRQLSFLRVARAVVIHWSTAILIQIVHFVQFFTHCDFRYISCDNNGIESANDVG